MMLEKLIVTLSCISGPVFLVYLLERFRLSHLFFAACYLGGSTLSAFLAYLVFFPFLQTTPFLFLPTAFGLAA